MQRTVVTVLLFTSRSPPRHPPLGTTKGPTPVGAGPSSCGCGDADAGSGVRRRALGVRTLTTSAVATTTAVPLAALAALLVLTLSDGGVRRPVGVHHECRRLAGTGVLGRPGRGRLVPGLALGEHRCERQLAARVDLLELDLDLLAHGEDVLDGVDPLASDELAHLRDVEKPVLARQKRDERTEGRRLDDRPEEALADLRHLGVGDGVDHRAG